MNARPGADEPGAVIVDSDVYPRRRFKGLHGEREVLCVKRSGGHTWVDYVTGPESQPRSCLMRTFLRWVRETEAK